MGVPTGRAPISCATPPPPACTAAGPASRRWPTCSATAPSTRPGPTPRPPAATTPLSQPRRPEVVRCFARYRAILAPDTEIPPERLLGLAHRRTAPHIYSEAELASLLAAARRLSSPIGLRPRTYATLI